MFTHNNIIETIAELYYKATILANVANFKVRSQKSNRTIDGNGYLHIANCVLTAEEVSDYLGREISGFRDLGLEPDRLYGIYRPLEELKKAVNTYNNIPLTDNHIVISPEKPAREKWYGTAGTNSRVEGGELLNTITVWVGKAIKEIESADEDPESGKKDLSCGYSYDLVPEKGSFGGKNYQFKMVNIEANHVALVEDGRVSGAQVADSAINNKGNIKMKFNLSKLLRIVARDSNKALDEEQKNELGKAMLDMARDANGDYEGNESELIKQLVQVALTLHGVQSAETGNPVSAGDEEVEADCNDEEPEDLKDKKGKDRKAKDKKARDEEKDDDKEEAEDADPEEDPKDKEKAMDAAINSGIQSYMKNHTKVVGLGQQILGKLSNDFLMDSDTKSFATRVLKTKGVACDSRSLPELIVMMEAVAQTKVSRPQVATDARAVASDEKQTYISNLPKRG